MVSQPERSVCATASRSSWVTSRSKTGISPSGDVPVAPIERVPEPIPLQRVEHLGDPVGHDHLGLEAQHGAALVEADFVIAQVAVAGHIEDLAGVGTLADLRDQSNLAVLRAPAG